MTVERRKHIAIIIPGGIGTGPGNIGVPVLERQVAMLAKEFDVAVFSLFKVNVDYRPDGFEIISIPKKNLFFEAWALFKIFRKQNRKSGFDVIHGFWILPSGFLAVILGKYFKIRTVVSVLGGDATALPEINYGQLRRRIPRWLAGWTIRNAGCVTALTQYLINNLNNNGITGRDIRIVPWGISNIQFKFTPVPIQPPLTFLHIGNFNAVKDQLTLLRAFKHISTKVNCHLTMIGEGSLEIVLRDWIADHGLSTRITIHRPVRYDELPVFYHSAMILLHTSLSEGQSEVVTEAMSSGVLVCGTRVGLLHDLPSCCVAVPVKDHEALADEILSLIKDEERIAVILKNARDWTHTHNLQWTVGATRALYIASESHQK